MEQIGGLIIFCVLIVAVVYLSSHQSLIDYKGKDKQEVKEVKQVKLSGMEQEEKVVLDFLEKTFDKAFYKVESDCSIKNRVKVLSFKVTPITKKENNEKK